MKGFHKNILRYTKTKKIYHKKKKKKNEPFENSWKKYQKIVI